MYSGQKFRRKQTGARDNQRLKAVTVNAGNPLVRVFKADYRWNRVAI